MVASVIITGVVWGWQAVSIAAMPQKSKRFFMFIVDIFDKSTTNFANMKIY
jgi:hypothetical protein